MSLFHEGVIPALDSDGRPISGATWDFYLTGTLTPTNVFADSALVTSLGSQEVADSAGRFVDIYLREDIFYRAILKDAGGATIKDIDPVNETISLSYTAPGTGANARTLLDRARDTTSVFDFMTTAQIASVRARDAIEDVTAAIQEAITAVIGTNGGGLYFPNGTYKITSKLTIPLSYGWRIHGESREGTRIVQYTNNTRIFSLETTNTHSWEIDHLDFSWNVAQSSANTQSIAVFMGTGVAGATFYNWQVHHCNFNKGFRGIASDSANSPSIWGLRVGDCLFNVQMSGASFFAVPAPAVGQPNICIENCTLHANAATEELVRISAGDVVTLRNLEFLNGTAPVRLVQINTTFQVTLMDCKSENYTVGTGGAQIFSFAQCNVRVFNTNCNGTLGSAGTSYFLFGDANTTMTIIGSSVSTLMSGGTLLAYSSGVLPLVADIALNKTGTGFASDNIRAVGNFALAKIDADKSQIQTFAFTDIGDANATLTSSSDKYQFQNVTLTTNRTITLPNTGLYDRMEFVIVRRAATPGAFTLGVIDPVSGQNFTFPAGVNGSVTYRCRNGTSWRIIDSSLVGGLQTLRVNASDMVPRTTGGCAALASVESVTNRVMTRVLDFDPTTAEFAQFTWTPPKSWDEGTVTAQFIWTATATGNVVWNIAGLALSDDDVIDTAFGTVQAVTDGVTATTDVMISAYTPAITIAGTPASEDMVTFQVSRDAANGADTLAADARLIAVRLKYTVNAADDT